MNLQETINKAIEALEDGEGRILEPNIQEWTIDEALSILRNEIGEVGIEPDNSVMLKVSLDGYYDPSDWDYFWSRLDDSNRKKILEEAANYESSLDQLLEYGMLEVISEYSKSELIRRKNLIKLAIQNVNTCT